jgi:hypothetical protein
LNRICWFLGVEEDLVTDVPSRNSTYALPTGPNRALQAMMRGGARLGALLPPRVWGKASAPIRFALHREGHHRPELTVEDGRSLVAPFVEDIRLLEQISGESFADWLDQRGGGSYSLRMSRALSRRAAW